MELDPILMHYALKHKKHMLELSKAIKPEYFTTTHRELYAILNAGFNDPRVREVMGLPALADYCDRHHLGHKKEALVRLYTDALSLKLDGREPVDTDFSYFVTQFKQRYNVAVVTRAMRGMPATLEAGVEEANSLLKSTMQEVQAINQGQVFDEGSLGEDVVSIYKEYEEISTRPEQYRGVMSGFASLDSITNGFFGGELIFIAGFEGSGKSIVSMNIAVNAWLGSNDPMADTEDFATDGKNVLYFSLEMPRSNRGEISSSANLNKRMMSCIGKIPNTPLRQGLLDAEHKERFRKACKFTKKYDAVKKLYVIDMPRGVTVEDIEVKYLELREKFEIDLVIIDYIGLMAGAEDEADWESQGKIAAGLHEFARVYRVPVISPVQLNRPGGANHSLNKQNYNNTRISRSAMITQNANIVIVIEYRDNEHQYPDLPIKITKMRDGAKMDLTFMKDFSNMRIYDALTVEQAAPSEFVDLGDDDNG